MKIPHKRIELDAGGHKSVGGFPENKLHAVRNFRVHNARRYPTGKIIFLISSSNKLFNQNKNNASQPSVLSLNCRYLIKSFHNRC